jgi:hypothetical protein
MVLVFLLIMYFYLGKSLAKSSFSEMGWVSGRRFIPFGI